MKTIRNIWKIEIKQLEKMKLKMVPKKRCNKSGLGGCPNLRVSRFGSWSGLGLAFWEKGGLMTPLTLALYQVPGRPGICLQEEYWVQGTWNSAVREAASQKPEPLHLTQQSIRNPSEPWEVGSSNRHSTPGKLTWNLKWEVTHRAKNCLSISTWQKLKSNDTGKG